MSGLTALVVLLVPSTAFSHVEMRATPAQIGAENALIEFDVQSESDLPTVRAEIFYPPEFAPNSLTPAKLPDGWNWEATDRGFAVNGSTLTPGADLEFTATATKLPTVDTVEFKVLQTYADGKVDRWIGDRFGKVDPLNPAAVLSLGPVGAADNTNPPSDEQASSSTTAGLIIAVTLALTATAGVVLRRSLRR